MTAVDGDPPGADDTFVPDESSEARVVRFWGALVLVLVTDLVTKAMVERAMLPWQPPRELLGSTVRVALAYNPGVAFGLSIGPASRIVFSLLVILIVAVLFHMYRRAPAGDARRPLALGLLCGGALGNLADRIRSANGVVDFIDIGVGDVRWWTFNVADIGVSAGAVMLAWILWNADDAAREELGGREERAPTATA